MALPGNEAKVLAALPGLKERAKTLVELTDSASYLWRTRPLDLEDKAAALLDAEGKAILAGLLPRLTADSEWSLASTEAIVKAYAETAGLKLGKVAQPLRAALTGRSTSPGIYDVLVVLGKDEALGRIADQAA
jgi:glutamyl-tRNA synthetase